MKGFIKCERTDCVNCKNICGEVVCQALYDNSEYEDYCPFYKNKQYAQEQKKRLALGLPAPKKPKNIFNKREWKGEPLLASKDDRYPDLKKGK